MTTHSNSTLHLQGRFVTSIHPHGLAFYSGREVKSPQGAKDKIEAMILCVVVASSPDSSCWVCFPMRKRWSRVVTVEMGLGSGTGPTGTRGEICPQIQRFADVGME